jgi:hypothetical protein
MTPSPDHHEKLERALHQTLRALPPRRAPRTLESRVFAELERRAALPWWRQSYAQWPLAARAFFLLSSAGLIKVAIMAVVWVMVGLDSVAFTEAFATKFALVDTVLSLLGDLVDSCAVLFHRIPSVWLYGAAAFMATMYFTLFGLGAAAYRAFFASQENQS